MKTKITFFVDRIDQEKYQGTAASVSPCSSPYSCALAPQTRRTRGINSAGYARSHPIPSSPRLKHHVKHSPRPDEVNRRGIGVPVPEDADHVYLPRRRGSHREAQNVVPLRVSTKKQAKDQVQARVGC